MYKLTIEFNTSEELSLAVAKLNGGTLTVPDKAAPEAEKPARKARTTKEEPKGEPQEDPKAESEKVPAFLKNTETAKKAEPKEESLTGEAKEEIKYEHCRDATILLQKISRAAAVDALAKFDAKVAPDLKPKQFAAFLDNAMGVLQIHGISTEGTLLEGM